MADEFYDFEKALNELKMEEEELKRLVSAGEIRAFRSKGQMKFRKADIEKLQGRDAGSLADELVFDEADALALDDDEGMATAKIDEQDTLIDEELPDLESDVSDLGAPVATTTTRTTTAARRTTRVTRMREAQEARKAASPMFVAVMILTTLAMLYGVIVVRNYANSENNGMTQGVTDFMVDTFTTPD